ncbi:caspase-3-like [Octopus vulgaris]|uniref:Caspase-3-like n=1 Tax=Octopus vulgaris TaxID=6645 RepID=A0AA36BYZ9_OCTVU|nr:caspase-3-like [Octopus vulgaris]
MAEGDENVGTSDQPHSPSKEDLSKCFPKYDINNKRLVAYIFNNESFEEPRLKDLKGSPQDTEDFKAALIKLGFSERCIVDWPNLTTGEMSEVLKNFNKDGRYENIGCFVCAIISHGHTNDTIFGKGRVPVGLHELLSYLTPEKCPSLSGVPKLIFTATCRGIERDKGVDISDEPEAEVNETNFPIMADLLVFHACYNGYKSFTQTEGSWLMQSLSKILSKYGTKKEILTLLTAVSNHVASLETKSSDEEKAHLKQMPQIVSTLLKELKFEAKK